jgi:hypothetical protein
MDSNQTHDNDDEIQEHSGRKEEERKDTTKKA